MSETATYEELSETLNDSEDIEEIYNAVKALLGLKKPPSVEFVEELGNRVLLLIQKIRSNEDERRKLGDAYENLIDGYGLTGAIGKLKEQAKMIAAGIKLDEVRKHESYIITIKPERSWSAFLAVLGVLIKFAKDHGLSSPSCMNVTDEVKTLPPYLPLGIPPIKSIEERFAGVIAKEVIFADFGCQYFEVIYRYNMRKKQQEIVIRCFNLPQEADIEQLRGELASAALRAGGKLKE